MKSESKGYIGSGTVRALAALFGRRELQLHDDDSWRAWRQPVLRDQIVLQNIDISENFVQNTEVYCVGEALLGPGAAKLNDGLRFQIGLMTAAKIDFDSPTAAQVVLYDSSSHAVRTETIEIVSPAKATGQVNALLGSSISTRIELRLANPVVQSATPERIPPPKIAVGHQAASGRSGELFQSQLTLRQGLADICLLPMPWYSALLPDDRSVLAQALSSKTGTQQGNVSLLGVFLQVPIGAITRIQVQASGAELALWLDAAKLQKKSYRQCTLIVGREISSGKLIQAVI